MTRIPERIVGLNTVDVIAGGVAAAIGVFVVVVAMSYPMGSVMRIGPGTFPLLLGFAMIGLGIAIALVDGRRGEGELPGRLAFRAILTIGAAIVAFALLIKSAGLAPAMVATVFIASFADRRSRPLKALLVAVGMAVLCVLIFDIGLGLQVKAFNW